MGRGTLWVATILVALVGSSAGDGNPDPIAELAKLVEQHNNNNNNRRQARLEENVTPQWREKTVVEVKKNINQKISKIIIRGRAAGGEHVSDGKVKKIKPYSRQLVDTKPIKRSGAIKIPLSTILLSKVPLNQNWKVEAKKIFQKEVKKTKATPIRIKMNKKIPKSTLVKETTMTPMIINKAVKIESKNSIKSRKKYKGKLHKNKEKFIITPGKDKYFTQWMPMKSENNNNLNKNIDTPKKEELKEVEINKGIFIELDKIKSNTSTSNKENGNTKASIDTLIKEKKVEKESTIKLTKILKRKGTEKTDIKKIIDFKKPANASKNIKNKTIELLVETRKPRVFFNTKTTEPIIHLTARKPNLPLKPRSQRRPGITKIRKMVPRRQKKTVKYSKGYTDENLDENTYSPYFVDEFEPEPLDFVKIAPPLLPTTKSLENKWEGPESRSTPDEQFESFGSFDSGSFDSFKTNIPNLDAQINIPTFSQFGPGPYENFKEKSPTEDAFSKPPPKREISHYRPKPKKETPIALTKEHTYTDKYVPPTALLVKDPWTQFDYPKIPDYKPAEKPYSQYKPPVKPIYATYKPTHPTYKPKPTFNYKKPTYRPSLVKKPHGYQEPEYEPAYNKPAHIEPHFVPYQESAPHFEPIKKVPYQESAPHYEPIKKVPYQESEKFPIIHLDNHKPYHVSAHVTKPKHHKITPFVNVAPNFDSPSYERKHFNIPKSHEDNFHQPSPHQESFHIPSPPKDVFSQSYDRKYLTIPTPHKDNIHQLSPHQESFHIPSPPKDVFNFQVPHQFDQFELPSHTIALEKVSDIHSQNFGPENFPSFSAASQPSEPLYNPNRNRARFLKLPGGNPGSSFHSDEVEFGGETGAFGSFRWLSDHFVTAKSSDSYHHY